MGMHIQPGWKRASLVLLAVLTLGACKDEEAQKRLNEATDKVVACKREVNELQNQVALLKRQLAQAMANPSDRAQTIELAGRSFQVLTRPLQSGGAMRGQLVLLALSQ